MLWLLNQARRFFWLFSLLVLPGTICHELCHWLLGRLLGARPVRFTVIPKREGRGFVLGSVSFANLRWYNAFFVGMAPLLLLPAAYVLLLWRLGSNPAFGWLEGAMVFLLANLVFGAIPSWQDLRIAARSPVGWLLLAGALAWGWGKVGPGRTKGPAPAPVVFQSP
jgi:CDP-diglyceride synthetase